MTIINMITVAVLYRYLSLSDNGIWIFYQTAIIFIDTFRTGLVNSAFVKFFSGATYERGIEIIGSTWVLVLLISGFFIIINIPFFFLLQNIDDEGIKVVIKYLAINLIISVPLVIALCKAQGELRFDRILYLRVCNNGLFLLFVFVLIGLNKISFQSVLYVNLVAVTITSAFALISGWSGIQFIYEKSWTGVKEIFHFGKYTVATSIGSSLFKVTDTFVINFMLGPAALAIFTLGQRLMEVVEIPLRSLTATAMPSLSAAYNQKNTSYFIILIKKYIGVVTILLIPALILGFIFADFAIGLVAGAKYVDTEAGNVFRIFITFALLYPADRFLATAIDAIHKPNINTIKVTIMLVINLVADIIGIYLFQNVYGIALASFFPILFAVITSFWFLNKYYVEYKFLDSYRLGFFQIKSFLSNQLMKFRPL